MSRRLSGLWGHSDFLKLWSGQTVSMFGSLIGRIALPMMVVLMLEATPMQVGLLRAVEVGPGLVAGPFSGVLVGRLPPRDEPLDDDDRAYMKAELPAPVRLLFPLLIQRPWNTYRETLRNGV